MGESPHLGGESKTKRTPNGPCSKSHPESELFRQKRGKPITNIGGHMKLR